MRSLLIDGTTGQFRMNFLLIGTSTSFSSSRRLLPINKNDFVGTYSLKRRAAVTRSFSKFKRVPRLIEGIEFLFTYDNSPSGSTISRKIATRLQIIQHFSNLVLSSGFTDASLKRLGSTVNNTLSSFQRTSRTSKSGFTIPVINGCLNTGLWNRQKPRGSIPQSPLQYSSVTRLLSSRTRHTTDTILRILKNVSLKKEAMN